MVNFSFYSEENFRFNLIKGQIAKELVKGLLEISGYKVYPFGYESSISQLRYDVQRRRTVPHTDSNDRMRSMPDLMVYDERELKTSFVEAKFRKTNSPEHVKLTMREIEGYQKYWGDCILVVVIPVEHCFYAQKISKVTLFNGQKSHQYNLVKDFGFIEDEFSRVTNESRLRYKAILEQFGGVLSVEQDDNEG